MDSKWFVHTHGPYHSSFQRYISTQKYIGTTHHRVGVGRHINAEEEIKTFKLSINRIYFIWTLSSTSNM